MYLLLSTLAAVTLAAVSPPLTMDVTPASGAAAIVDVDLLSRSQSQGEVEPVDINTASAEELQKVPGIGEALARRIIEFREEHGRFEKVDDLLNVRGIGVTSLEKLRPYLVVKENG
jgi:competence protein ComEA